MKKNIAFGFSILSLSLLLSCSKNSSLETPEAKSAIESQLMSKKLSDSPEASEIRSILHKLDYGTEEERKSILKLLVDNQKGTVPSVNTKASEKLSLNTLQVSNLLTPEEVINQTTSFPLYAERDEDADMRYSNGSLGNYGEYAGNDILWRYKWTVADGFLLSVKSQEVFTLNTNPDPTTYGTTTYYKITQPTVHESSYILGFSPGVSWQETSNAHYDGIYYAYLACDGVLAALGYNKELGSARYVGMGNLVRSNGKEISLY